MAKTKIPLLRIPASLPTGDSLVQYEIAQQLHAIAKLLAELVDKK